MGSLPASNYNHLNMNANNIVFILIAVAMFAIAGCDTDIKKTVQTQKQKNIVFNPQGTLYFLSNKKDTLAEIEIEIANTPQSRQQGMMHRDSLRPLQGMLFVFETEEMQSFWMLNTKIPLDIVFVDSKFKVVHIARNAIPNMVKSIGSVFPARFVVEVNAGFCKKHNIAPACFINFTSRPE